MGNDYLGTFAHDFMLLHEAVAPLQSNDRPGIDVCCEFVWRCALLVLKNHTRAARRLSYRAPDCGALRAIAIPQIKHLLDPLSDLSTFFLCGEKHFPRANPTSRRWEFASILLEPSKGVAKITIDSRFRSMREARFPRPGKTEGNAMP